MKYLPFLFLLGCFGDFEPPVLTLELPDGKKLYCKQFNQDIYGQIFIKKCSTAEGIKFDISPMRLYAINITVYPEKEEKK